MIKIRNKKASNSGVFISIGLFWIILFVLFDLIGSNINTVNGYRGYNANDVTNTGFNILSFGSNITFIFKVMLWQVPQQVGIPAWISLFLDFYAVLTAWIFINWLRGT